MAYGTNKLLPNRYYMRPSFPTPMIIKDLYTQKPESLIWTTGGMGVSIMKGLEDMHDTITYLQKNLYDQYAKEMGTYEQYQCNCDFLQWDAQSDLHRFCVDFCCHYQSEDGTKKGMQGVHWGKEGFGFSPNMGLDTSELQDTGVDFQYDGEKRFQKMIGFAVAILTQDVLERYKSATVEEIMKMRETFCYHLMDERVDTVTMTEEHPVENKYRLYTIVQSYPDTKQKCYVSSSCSICLKEEES